MQELIKIENKEFNNESIRTVNARELWEQLGNKKRFADWIKARIEKYSFFENVDFVSFNKKIIIEKTNLKKHIIEYYLTLESAMIIALTENTEIGKSLIKYFLANKMEYNPKDMEPQFVYIFKDKEYYKIGKTQDINQRIKTLRTGNINIKFIMSKMVIDAYETEKQLHNIFKNKCIDLEWFNLDDGDIRYLVQLGFNYAINK